MNYIQEINQFYIRTETNPVSPGAGILWYALMHVNNRTKWSSEFSVPASVLSAKSSLSVSALKRARKELVEKGYIIVTSRGTKAPLYKFNSAGEVTQVPDQVTDDNQAKDQTMSETNHNLSGYLDQVATQEASSLYKQNETKRNKTLSSTSSAPDVIFKFYSENFGTLTGYIQSELNYSLTQFTSDLVLEALKRAAENGKASWNYALGILKKWQKDNITSMQEVREAEDKFRKQRATQSASASLRVDHRRKEVIPDWFREDRLKKGIIV